MAAITGLIFLTLAFIWSIARLIIRYANLNTIQNALIATTSLGLYATTFQEQYKEDDDFYYANARAAGTVLKYTFPLVFIPTLRVLNKTFHHLSPTKKIAEHINRYSSHKVLGLSMMAFTGVHIAAHVLNKIQKDEINLVEQEWLTGSMMAGLLLLPLGGMYFLRSQLYTRLSYYSQFLLPHQLGWWGLTLGLAVHTKDLRLLPISLMVISSFSADRLAEWLQSKTTTVHSIELIHNNMMVVAVNKPRNYQNKPGDYALLAAPWFSYFFNAVHPFTIASSNDNEHIRFIISQNGNWTRQLLNNLAIGSKVQLSSSFPSHLTLPDITQSRFMLITSGSGLAMTAAYLSYFRAMNAKIDYLAIYHSTREINEIRFLLKLIEESTIVVDKIQFNMTTKVDDLRALTNKTALCEIEQKRLNPRKNLTIREFQGHLFFCGNQNLAKELKTACPSSRIEYF